MVIELINKLSKFSPRAVGLLNIFISLILDITSSLLAFFLTFVVRFELGRIIQDPLSLFLDRSWIGEYGFQLHFGFSLFIVSVLLIMLFRNGLYSTQRGVRYSRELAGVLDSSLWALLFGILIAFLLPDLRRLIARSVLFGQVILAIPLLFEWRFLRRKLLERRYGMGFGRINTIIIGAGRIGNQLTNWLKKSPWLGFHVVGFLDDVSSDVDEKEVIGTLNQFEDVVRAHKIQLVFITIPSQRNDVIAITEVAYRYNIEVKVVPEMFDLLTREVSFETLGPFTVGALKKPTLTRSQKLLKRVEDLMISIPMLIIFLPLALLIAIVIKLDSSGPFLFMQERIGSDGKPFSLFKFRTMFIDVDQEDHRKAALNFIQSRDADPRFVFEKIKKRKVTRAGRVLRRFGLDEVPQFLNVVKGEMSVVGPRPSMLYEYENFPDYYKKRILVKPGITGLWQVSDRYTLTFEQMVLQDIRYINEWSLLLDLRIIVETIPLLVLGKGM